MIEILLEFGLFLAKAVTVLLILLLLLSAVAAAAARQRRGADQGRIEVHPLHERIEDMRDTLLHHILEPKAYKKQMKAEAKARKKETSSERRRVWVLRFDGDLQASAVEAMREEITAILTLAESGDEVVACIESPGGMVHGYGLAASQLHRLREREGVTLTVAVDMVAASGGYLMACVGHRILAAPFAVLGSIGVVAQIPNVHRLLKRNDIDVEILTAGEHKRTLTVFGQNTEEGRTKFLEELEDIHALFKEYVIEARPQLDLSKVATGEAWYGRRALELGLVDELITSDAYLAKACTEADVFEIRWVQHRHPMERFLNQGMRGLVQGLERLWLRWRDRQSWTG